MKRLLNFQIGSLDHHTSWLYRRSLSYLTPRRVMRWLLLGWIRQLRETLVDIPLLVDSMLRNLLLNKILLVTLASELLLVVEPLVLWILVSPLLKPLVVLVLTLEYRVVLPNLLEVRRFCKVLPDIVELLRFAVALVWTLLLTVLSSTDSTINLLLFLVFFLRRLSENLS